MDKNDKFMRRSACWQIIIGDQEIDVTHEGVIEAAYGKDAIKSAAIDVGKRVEKTILDMQENNAHRLIMLTSWD